MDKKGAIEFASNILPNFGQTLTEIMAKVQKMFNEQSLGRKQVPIRHALFKTGRTHVDDDDHTGTNL